MIVEGKVMKQCWFTWRKKAHFCALSKVPAWYSLIDYPLPAVQPTDWTIKINKKERRLAVATALQSAAGDIKVIEDIKVGSQYLM